MAENNQNENQYEHNDPAKDLPKQSAGPPEGIPMVPLAKYEELKQHANICLNMAREVQADFDNYKRRNQNLKQEGIDEGVKKACDTILPALDSFKKARKLIIDRSTINGILMIETTLLNALEYLGIKRIPAYGHPFNPEFHHAIMLVEDFKAKSNTIIEELQSGYTLNGKVIRIAQVVVAK